MVPSALSSWGSIMSKRLSADDRHAIDLILERPDGQGNTPLVEMVFARPVKAKFEERLDKVETILTVLSAMPAEEPPMDLVSKTLQRIEEAELSPRAMRAPKQRATRSTTRHA